MITLKAIILVLSFICFLLSAFEVKTMIKLFDLGVAFYVLSILVP
jgi:hypothetical protein